MKNQIKEYYISDTPYRDIPKNIRMFIEFRYIVPFWEKKCRLEKWIGKKIIYPLIIKLIKLEFKLRNTGISKDWSAYSESDIIREFRRKTKPNKYHYSHVWDDKKQKYV